MEAEIVVPFDFTDISFQADGMHIPRDRAIALMRMLMEHCKYTHPENTRVEVLRRAGGWLSEHVDWSTFWQSKLTRCCPEHPGCAGCPYVDKVEECAIEWAEWQVAIEQTKELWRSLGRPIPSAFVAELPTFQKEDHATTEQ